LTTCANTSKTFKTRSIGTKRLKRLSHNWRPLLGVRGGKSPPGKQNRLTLTNYEIQSAERMLGGSIGPDRLASMGVVDVPKWEEKAACGG